MVLFGGLFEATSVALDNLSVWHATREAARIAAVEPDPSVVRAVAERVVSPLDLSITPGSEARVAGEPVVVSTSYRPDAAVPLIGALFERLRLTARVAMRIEVP